MAGGDLFDRIGKRKNYNEKDAMTLCKKMVESVCFCHENSVVRGLFTLQEVKHFIFLSTTESLVWQYSYRQRFHVILYSGTSRYETEEFVG